VPFTIKLPAHTGQRHVYRMKAYLLITGVIFALITIAHIFEVIARHRIYASDLIVTGLSIGLAVWAGTLARKRG
jgi:hypothetical protein